MSNENMRFTYLLASLLVASTSATFDHAGYGKDLGKLNIPKDALQGPGAKDAPNKSANDAGVNVASNESAKDVPKDAQKDVPKGAVTNQDKDGKPDNKDGKPDNKDDKPDNKDDMPDKKVGKHDNKDGKKVKKEKDDADGKSKCICTAELAPVCANGKTYENPSQAKCAGVTNFTSGACPTGNKSETPKTQPSTASVTTTSVLATTTSKPLTTPMPEINGYKSAAPAPISPTPTPASSAKPDAKPGYGSEKPSNVEPSYSGEKKPETLPSYGNAETPETKSEQDGCDEESEETPVCYNGQTYPSEGQALAKGADRSQIIKGACKKVEEPAVKNALYCGSSVKEDGTCSGTTSFEGSFSSAASMAWNSLVALVFVLHF